ncbi:DUF6318 family protein [Aeromicrobium duanguangcaii]|uniref:DUF6318 family protein n=1 Tax=Aeromicrobium duanguangcaii TaxID=2968086 RepID=A0ABY5KHC4_9ACTN|nr:DUF6318 family protein [Aeromicrobium duanguangcaii]MCD9153159.1 DUF6318 family protein [Aeromicrobium duanguangcaii]UUI69740.1 DUF6318 family protein [Aeromicrobium duanguangcaii]
MRILATAVVASLALSLGACSEDDPRPADPTSAATTPANPDATLPPMPAEAKADSHSGASQFVRYYAAVLNYSALTGDVRQMETLSDPDCDSCRTYIDLFAKTYEDGGFFRGGTWSFGEAKVRYTSANDPAHVTATVHISGGSQKLTSDSDLSTSTPKKSVLTFQLAPGEPRRMAEILKGDFR